MPAKPDHPPFVRQARPIGLPSALLLVLAAIVVEGCSFFADTSLDLVPCELGSDCASGLCSPEGYCVVSVQPGNLGGPCFANGSCYQPLVCVAERCRLGDDVTELDPSDTDTEIAELVDDEALEGIEDGDGDSDPEVDLDVSDEDLADEDLADEDVPDEDTADEDLADEDIADEDIADEDVIEPPVCEPPQVLCGETCVSLGSTEHCGGCGDACGTGAQCCRFACIPNTELCNWWEVGWSARLGILVDAAASELPVESTLCASFDHAALVDAGLARADGADVRVRRWDGATWQAVPWVLDPESGWDVVDTSICFATVTPVAANASDHEYAIYTGNSGASAERYPYDQVFWAGDDFGGATLTSGVSIDLKSGYTSSLSGGEHRLASGNTNPAGCAVVAVNTPLPHLRFVACARVALTDTAITPSSVRALGLGQSDVMPTCADATWVRLGGALSNSMYRLFRVDTGGTQQAFHNVTSTWVANSEDPGMPSSLGTFVTVCLESDGTQLRASASRDGGAGSFTTGWFPRAEVQDAGSNYWLAWGEALTSNYAADLASDWFAVALGFEFPPSVVVGAVEEQ